MTRSATELTLIAATVLAGALLPLQALINGRLGAHLGSPIWAGALQNVIGAVVMVTVAFVLRAQFPSAGQLAGPPAWAWLGGALGATYVMVALLATPRLGAGPAVVAMIAGQLTASLVLDHFGVLHARRPIDWSAVLGVVLVASGAAIILRRA
jgi:transporter family-2 protein